MPRQTTSMYSQTSSVTERRGKAGQEALVADPTGAIGRKLGTDDFTLAAAVATLIGVISFIIALKDAVFWDKTYLSVQLLYSHYPVSRLDAIQNPQATRYDGLGGIVEVRSPYFLLVRCIIGTATVICSILLAVGAMRRNAKLFFPFVVVSILNAVYSTIWVILLVVVAAFCGRLVGCADDIASGVAEWRDTSSFCYRYGYVVGRSSVVIPETLAIAKFYRGIYATTILPVLLWVALLVLSAVTVFFAQRRVHNRHQENVPLQQTAAVTTVVTAPPATVPIMTEPTQIST